MSKLMRNVDVNSKIKYLIFLFFTLDVFLMGSGTLYTIFGVTTRKLLFAIFCIFSVITYFWSFQTKPILQRRSIAGFVLFVTLWVAIIPLYITGNISYSLADALPLIGSGVYLLTVDFSRHEGSWINIRKVIFFSLIAFTVLHIILYGLSIVKPHLAEVAGEFLRLLWEPDNAPVELFVFLTPLNNGLLRVYFGSSFFLLMGLYFAAQKYQSPIEGCVLCRAIVYFLVILALWATNTRSLLLGAVVFVFILPIVSRVFEKIPRNFGGVLLLLVAPFLLSFILIPTFDPQFLSNFGIAREGSDDLRAEQFEPLLGAFLDSPLIGQGFGASVSVIRAEDAPYSYELSILDLFMKIGVLGFLFAVTILAGLIYSSIPKDIKFFPKNIAPLYALYFSYIFSCFFNPYMFGFFGTFFSLFLLYEAGFLGGFSKHD